MKKGRLLQLFSIITLAAAGVFGVVSNKSSKKSEVVEAGNILSYSKIYRFTAPAEYWGGTVYVHAWGSSTSSNNTTWPGINLSSE